MHRYFRLIFVNVISLHQNQNNPEWVTNTSRHMCVFFHFSIGNAPGTIPVGEDHVQTNTTGVQKSNIQLVFVQYMKVRARCGQQQDS